MSAVANAGSDFSCYAGQAVILNGAASSGYTVNSQTDGTPSIIWTTGDGSDIERLVEGPHGYLQAGTYTATLTGKDTGGGSSSDTATVTVTDLPAASAPNIQVLTDSGNSATNKTALQSLINTAFANSNTNEIRIPVGASVDGGLNFPSRSASTFVTIRPVSLSGLPNGTTRVTTDTSGMWKLKWGTVAQMTQSSAIYWNTGAKYCRIIGMYGEGSGGDDESAMFNLADNETTAAHGIFDRCVVSGNGYHRNHAFAWYGAEFSLINSRVVDIQALGTEAKGFISARGAGPSALINNEFEVAAVASMLGGGPAGITSSAGQSQGHVFRGNYCHKNLSWTRPPSGTAPVVKNFWEVKYGFNSVVVGNIFENNWRPGQSGNAITLKTGLDSANIYVYTSGVDIRWNKITSFAGIDIIGLQDGGPEGQQLTNYGIKNNLWILNDPVDGHGYHIFHSGSRDGEFNHNTWATKPNFTADRVGHLFMDDAAGGTAARIKFLNDIADGGDYGYYIYDTATAHQGTAALDDHVSYGGSPSWTYSKNVLFNGAGPTNNFYPSTGTVTDEFTNAAGGDYSLKTASAYKAAATDGLDVGADIAGLNTRIANVVTGTWTIGGSSTTAPVYYRLLA